MDAKQWTLNNGNGQTQILIEATRKPVVPILRTSALTGEDQVR